MCKGHKMAVNARIMNLAEEGSLFKKTRDILDMHSKDHTECFPLFQ